MEAIATVSAILGTIDISLKLTKNLYTVAGDFKTAPQDIISLAAEAEFTTKLVRELDTLIKDNPNTKALNETGIALAKQCRDDSETTLKALIDLLRKAGVPEDVRLVTQPEDIKLSRIRHAAWVRLKPQFDSMKRDLSYITIRILLAKTCVDVVTAPDAAARDAGASKIAGLHRSKLLADQCKRDEASSSDLATANNCSGLDTGSIASSTQLQPMPAAVQMFMQKAPEATTDSPSDQTRSLTACPDEVTPRNIHGNPLNNDFDSHDVKAESSKQVSQQAINEHFGRMKNRLRSMRDRFPDNIEAHLSEDELRSHIEEEFATIWTQEFSDLLPEMQPKLQHMGRQKNVPDSANSPAPRGISQDQQMTQGLSPPKARDIPSWRCVVLHVTKRRTAKPLIVMLDYKKFQDHTNANGFGTWSELATESRTAVYRFLEDWLRRNNQSMLNWNWDLSAIEHLGEDEHRVRKLVLRVLPQCFVPTEEEDNAMVMLVAKPLASYFAKPSSEPQVSIRRARRSFSAEQSLSPLLRCADGPFRFNKIKLDPVVLDDKVRIIYPDADDTSPQGSDVQPYAGPAPITPSNGAEANEIHLKHGRISSMGPSGDSERPSPDMSPYSTALGRRVMIPRSSTQSTGRRHAMKGLRPIQRDKNDDERLRDEILLQYTGKRLGDLVDGRK